MFVKRAKLHVKERQRQFQLLAQQPQLQQQQPQQQHHQQHQQHQQQLLQQLLQPPLQLQHPQQQQQPPLQPLPLQQIQQLSPPLPHTKAHVGSALDTDKITTQKQTMLLTRQPMHHHSESTKRTTSQPINPQPVINVLLI